jgi:hypothetical protein
VTPLIAEAGPSLKAFMAEVLEDFRKDLQIPQ